MGGGRGRANDCKEMGGGTIGMSAACGLGGVVCVASGVVVTSLTGVMCLSVVVSV